MIALNENVTAFLCNYSILNVYPNKARETNYLLDFNLPSLLCAVEGAVCRRHFALTLDALIDNLLNKIAEAKSLREVEECRQDIDKFRMQAGLMLEEISQYVKGGLLGTQATFVLKEVFQAKELEDRVLRKVDLVAKLMESRGWSLRFSGLDKFTSK
ncbi:hypothetical protein ES703_100346 [subsurface metagenome]